MKLISANMTRTVGRAILQAKKNSPHIFFASGLLGVVGSTVLACRATLKLEDTLDEIKLDLENVKVVNDTVVQDQGEHYRAMGRVYVDSAVKMGKLYGPSVALGTISIAALSGSHLQLTRRNTALSATLAAATKAFEDYRLRVRDEVGEERELALYRCEEDCEIEEDGKKKLIKAVNPNGLSIYARFFDEGSSSWQKDAEMNRIFLQCQQNYANHLLHARGHVFLNDVYDLLDLPRSSAGAIVGWVINGSDKSDNFIDFGLYEVASTDFINGHEPRVLLDFNVDGVVYDKI